MMDITTLYDLAIEDDLTTKRMKISGFCSYDLKKLIHNHILQRIQRGKYKLIDIDGLYEYGKNLISDGNREKAQLCFKRCYELDSKHSPSCFQMFFQSVYDKQYEDAYKFLRQLISDSKKYEKDYKLYLFLLSNIYDLSNEDEEYVKTLEIDDIFLEEENMEFQKEYLDVQNKIRYDILDGKFSKAISRIQQLDKIPVSNLIIKELLLSISKKYKKLDKNILDLIQQKNYTEIINILETEKQSHRFNAKYDLALEICYNIEKMLSTGTIYEYNSNFDKFDINGTIYSNEYEKAIAFLEKNGKVEYLNNKHILYMLLVDAVKIKNKIEEEEEDLINKIALLYKNKTFIVLNNLTEIQKKKLDKVLKAKTNIQMKKFDTGTDEVLLLKYQEKDYSDEKMDNKTILKTASKYLNQGKYEESLYLYKKVIRVLENPKSFIYANMGAIYNKLSKKKDAKLCYFIADIVARAEEDILSYYNKNARLNPYSKQTYNLHMKESDFYDDIHDYYGIPEAEDILKLKENGNNLEEIFSQYDLSFEKKNIIKLIVARNYYYQKNFKAGDQLYKDVETSKEKSLFLKGLLGEIQINRKLYQYRNNVKQLKK